MNGEVGRADAGNGTIVVLQGDITAQEVSAVVNAANTRLQHGGGVAAAIAKAGGPDVQRESDDWVDEHGELEPGTAAVTTAGDMPADMVVHVAGPVYDADADDNEKRLRMAVAAALDAADDAAATSIAFPAISAGTYGYPRDEATAIIVDEARTWLEGGARSISEVRLVGFDEGTASDFVDALGG